MTDIRSESGDGLVARIVDPATTDDDRMTATMELLSNLFAGYDIRRIAPLLRSDQVKVVRAGMFLASEMSTRAVPLLDDIGGLLTHPEPWVRHDAIEVILAAATASDGHLVARAIERIGDPHPVIRQDVMRLLGTVDANISNAAVSHLEPPLAALTRWLGGQHRSDMAAYLASPEAVYRMFAAAAIVRLDPADPDLLAEASKSTDPDVSQFAEMRKRANRNRRHRA